MPFASTNAPISLEPRFGTLGGPMSDQALVRGSSLLSRVSDLHSMNEEAG